MKNQHSIPLAVVSLLLLLAVATPAAESLSVLLQKGIYAEETEGNLDAAIKIYEGIVKDADANRSLVAQAQYRLGVCELKRGKKDEAAAAFRRLIDQFSDAAELVVKSRERLTELGQPAASVTVRQIWTGKDAAGDRISPDGRYLAWVDWNTGNLMIRGLANSQNRQVTTNGSWTEPVQFAESCAFSRDGKQLAYDWQRVESRTTSSCGLYVMNLQDGTVRTIIDQQTNRWFVGAVGDWTPDGRSVAVFEYDRVARNWQGGISLIDIASGGTRKVDHHVLRGNWSVPSVIRFSPDGQYLSYNLARNSDPDGKRTNDIYVLELSTGIAKRVVEHLANEKFLGWALRSSEIIFSSERAGTPGLWSVAVDGGEREPRPRLLKADLGEIQPMGVTDHGAFFYSTAAGAFVDLYVTDVDFQVGKILSAPKFVQTLYQPYRMQPYQFQRSRDGGFSFFRSGNKEPAAYMLSTETLKVQEIKNSKAWASRMTSWWPLMDGTSLWVRLQDGREGGFYLVNTQSGALTPLALDRPDDNVQQGGHYNPIRPQYDGGVLAYGRRYVNEGKAKLVLVKHDLKSHRETEHEIPGMPTDPIPGDWRNRHALLGDGRTFLFNRRSSADGTYALVRHDLMTGEQKEIFRSESYVGVIFPLGVSRDHLKRIFLVAPDERGRLIFRLYSYENSELRQTAQVTVPEDFAYRGEDWNEPHLILVKKEDDKPERLAERWTLSVRTSELKSTGFLAPAGQFLGIAAARGKPFVFPVTRPPSREIWVMEHFLPLAAGVK